MSDEALPTASSYAVVMSAIKERQRSTKSRRCSASGTWSPRRRRNRKYCRRSSNGVPVHSLKRRRHERQLNLAWPSAIRWLRLGVAAD